MATDPLRGIRKILPAPVATAVLLFKASDSLPVAYYPEHFEGDYVARELHSVVKKRPPTTLPNKRDPLGSDMTRFHIFISDPPKTTVAARQWEFHTFVLSGADNYRTYGHCLRFSYDNGTVRSSSSKSAAHLDHALVVLSAFPFFDSMKTWLVPVVKDMISATSDQRMSIEPRISSLIHDAIAIRSNFIATNFSLHSPPALKRTGAISCGFALAGDTSVIPPLHFSMQAFLASVNPNILVSIFELLLYAGHILFVSSRVSLLTLAAQSCISLIWPLSWDFAIYIPILPNQIGIDAMNFPNAAVVGILRSHPELPERLEDVLQYNDALLIVDLDENRMIVGENCRPSRLPPNIREKLIERLKLILSPHLVLCDAVDPDLSSDSPLESQLTSFGSPALSVTPEDQVRIAFLLLLRDLCDGSSFEQKPLDEFKAAFLASPIYSLYQRNAHENSILKKLIRMTEEKATAYLLGRVPNSASSGSINVPPFHSPQQTWDASEAALVPNEAGLASSDLNLFKSAFPAPNQRANELFLQAELAYNQAVTSGASQALLNDWILIQISFLLRSKRHHECIRLLGKLESEHPIFLCNDLMTLLMESLTAIELDTMSTRQSGDRLGDAARAFRETKSRQQPTTLSPESKELYQFIMTQEDTAADAKYLDMVMGRNVNVNATPQGISLLSTAVSMGKLRMAAGLLKYGATPDNDSAKNTIAHSLCSTKPRDEISYLLGIRILCLALATGFNINRGDSYQAAPLSLLCSRPVPFIPLMKFFLCNGADLNSLNVDELPAAHFLVKTRMQQLVDISPLVLLLDMGANPLISTPSAQSFRALISSASDAVTNNLQPISVYLENNKYLSAKYAVLRGLKSSVQTTAAGNPAQKRDEKGPTSPNSGRIQSSVIPPLPNIGNALPSLPTASSSTATSSADSKQQAPSISPRSIGSSTLTAAMASMSVNASGTPGSLKPRSYGTLAAAANSETTIGSSSSSSSVAASASISSNDKNVLLKVTEANEALALSNYAIVEAQYRQLLILNALVHRYLVDVAKRKRKGTFGFNKRRSSPHDTVLALAAPLQNLLLHHATLSVDIRHHTTIYGSKPSVAACFSSKIALLSDAQIEFTSSFYSNDGRMHLDALNGDDMVSILAQESAAFASLCGSWVQSDSLLGNLIMEVMEFPVKLSVLFEDLAKRSAVLQTADTGKIQVLLTQLNLLRNRQDRLKHEAQMVQVLEEVGTKLTGIAQFSFMMASGTTLLKSGNVRQVRNIDAPGLSKVPNNEVLQSRAYLFATNDENDNKGYLLLSCESISERKRIPLKKAIVFDVPSFSSNHLTPSSLTASSSSSVGDCTLMHAIGIVALHPSSTPHEFYMLECPTHESKVSWLSLLWRLCFEGRNWTHKRHFYEYVDRNPPASEYEGWLDYSVDNQYTCNEYTHYFSLRGNRLVATISPSDANPIVIIFLDEYTVQVNDEPSVLHNLSFEPAKHLAPRYLFRFGATPKVLTKFPANSTYTDWRAVFKHLFGATNIPKMS